jgi:uncharacterized membrane protein YfhO
LSTDNSYREKVFVWGKPPELQQCGGDDELILLRRESQRAAIYADMRCRGMVILADTYYPGWEALVDGKAAPIWDAYTIVRGVVVDKGRHVIEMRFRPASVKAGLGMTIVGLLLTLGIALVDGRYKP